MTKRKTDETSWQIALVEERQEDRSCSGAAAFSQSVTFLGPRCIAWRKNGAIIVIQLQLLLQPRGEKLVIVCVCGEETVPGICCRCLTAKKEETRHKSIVISLPCQCGGRVARAVAVIWSRCTLDRRLVFISFEALFCTSLRSVRFNVCDKHRVLNSFWLTCLDKESLSYTIFLFYQQLL